jgi:single-strand DNA-binding protein
MAQSVNRVTLIGRLGKDPEVRHTQSGKPIVSLNLATTDSWKDKASGEKKEKTVWHRVVIFNEGLAKVAEQYLSKGSLVYIEGSIDNRKYTDKDGVEKSISEIVLQAFNGTLVMLGDKGGGSRNSDDHDGGGGDQAPPAKAKAKSYDSDLDDSVPF